MNIPVIVHRCTKRDSSYEQAIFLKGSAIDVRVNSSGKIYLIETQDCFLLSGTEDMEVNSHVMVLQTVESLRLYDELQKLDRQIFELGRTRELKANKLLDILKLNYVDLENMLEGKQATL